MDIEKRKEDTWGRTERDWDGSFKFVLIVYFVIMLAFVCLRVSASLWLNFDPENDAAWRWVDVGFTVIAQIMIMTAIPLFALHVWHRKKAQAKRDPLSVEMQKTSFGSTFASFGFDKPSVRVIAFAFLLGFIAYFFNIFVSGLFNGVLSLFGYRFPGGGFEVWSGVGGLFALLALVAVLPGFCEEVTHRGMLMRSFASRMGIMRAILFSSIMFGFMHLNIVQVFFAAILGYVIAIATVAMRSLWVGVIMHFMNNAMGIYLMFANRNGWFAGDFLERTLDGLSYFGILLFPLVIGGGFWLMFIIIRMFARENFLKRKTEHLGSLIQNNPAVLQHDGGIYSFEEFTQVVDNATQRMGWWQRFKFYIDPVGTVDKKPMNLTRGEATWFYGVLFLGGIITLFTMVWGFL
ncbi:MAG: CPBP family intramembrane metalloprotease [Firmicutes bacterium]|nr:CPBP family intramembrane metalloprotease [Bacillota bacterium]